MDMTKKEVKNALPFSKRFPTPESAEALTSAFNTMIEDGEALLKATTNYSAESLGVAREEFRNRLEQAKSRVHDLQSTIIEKKDHAKEATRNYVSGHPFQSIALASSVGLLIGFLLRRNDH